MIIALSGKIGAGKDAAGIYLQNTYGFKIIKFATLIKQITAQLTNTSIEMQNTQKGKQTYLKDWGMTIREFQQRLGTDAMREGLHKNCWVIATLNKYNPKKHKWVITDTRFKNEADEVRNLGGQLLRITRPNNPFPQSNHQSEIELDDYNFDYYIVNSGSLEDLYTRMEDFLRDIKKGSQ